MSQNFDILSKLFSLKNGEVYHWIGELILELNELFDLSGPFVVEIKSHEHCIEFTVMVSQ